MKRSRLRATERGTLRAMGEAALLLREDYPWRLRNALLALALSNPRWMVIVEEMLPRRLSQVTRADVQAVESLARWCVLLGYSFFCREKICGMVFRDDWAFTDAGVLSPG